MPSQRPTSVGWAVGTKDSNVRDISNRARDPYAGANCFPIGPDGTLSIEASVERLGQCDDDALGAAHIAEPIAVLVLHDLADKLGAVAAQAAKDVIDVVHSEHDPTDAQRVHRRIFRLGPDRSGRVVLVQLDTPVAIRGPHRDDGGSDIVEPDEAVDGRALDGRLALTLETEFSKERSHSLEVVDNDQDIVHTQQCHVPSLGTGWFGQDL